MRKDRVWVRLFGILTGIIGVYLTMNLNLVGIPFLIISILLFKEFYEKSKIKINRKLVLGVVGVLIVLLSIASIINTNVLYQSRADRAEIMRQCIREHLHCDYYAIVGVTRTTPFMSVPDANSACGFDIYGVYDVNPTDCYIGDTEQLVAIDDWDSGVISDGCLLAIIDLWSLQTVDPDCGGTTTTLLTTTTVTPTTTSVVTTTLCPAIPITMWCIHPTPENSYEGEVCPMDTDEQGCYRWRCDLCVTTTTICPIIPPGTWCPGREGEELCPKVPGLGGCPMWRCDLCEEEPDYFWYGLVLFVVILFLVALGLFLRNRKK